ncbi:M4 family metallopeptidase [Vitiosangium sp. GDMCC 1.1324]|uniref:M4 family metallopeptidase n=1 Tax=Vitiosangium sp. (strain GDMCC 1.1324) TaxID=2138576 RepID=UPI001E5B7A52|nr:M4 family metallopeptidase [Vitiosangium sp. GDMCC 1.1324]
MKTPILRSLGVVWAGLALSACGVVGEERATAQVERDGSDIQAALSALQNAKVLGLEGEIPYFIRGQLGRVGTGMNAQLMRGDTRLHESLRGIAPVFRLRGEDLVLSRVHRDEQGHQHLRFQQLKNGLKVVGGELILHADAEGLIYAANGSARDGVDAAVAPKVSEEAAVVAAVRGSDVRGAVAEGTAPLVYLLGEGERQTALAYEVRVKGERDDMPADDLVYVDAGTGALLAVHPQVHSALSRRVYSANNGTSLPGTLRRSEGSAATGDTHVDTNYLKLGGTYDCYKNNFGRDSFDNAGAPLISTVHYSSNYVNAYWNGTQMVYGDGDGVNSGMLGLSADVTTHELTHAVTEHESNLTYSGESGGLNEALSDIFGAYCESYASGTWATTNAVFMVGDDIWTPAIPGDALRYMYDPAKDGSSLDYWTSGAGSVDVHYSSGIANLAFTLLSKGGTHPRGKSTVNVTGIGVQKAGAIFYKANVDFFTASTTFAQARTYTEQAASALGYSVAPVTEAWAAVGLAPPPDAIPLMDGVPVTGLGGATDSVQNFVFEVPTVGGGTCGKIAQLAPSSLTIRISGGTGNADLYVKSGSQPTFTSYDCRPHLDGNDETCVFNNVAPGSKWYVMLHAVTAYSGVTLRADYTNPTPGPITGSVLTGQEVHYGPFCVAAGKRFRVVMTGTGDPDLYVRWDAAPTVSQYNCRPYLSGASETCDLTVPLGVKSAYIMVRGYTAGTYSLVVDLL